MHNPPVNLPPNAQQLLASFGNQPSSGYEQAASHPSHFNLAALLGSQPSMQQNHPHAAPPASMPQMQNQSAPQPDMQEIMAQLAKYQR
jgi:hypothetical protein